jgi:N-glycosylase/DNA lyase
MQYAERNKCIELWDITDFDPIKTFECGQCFRWNADSEGVYTGVVKNRAAKVWKQRDTLFISGNTDDFHHFWRDYFDLDRDYEALSSMLDVHPYIKKAAAFGTGIRILRQDSWECLCSFILSQCNNIPRIKKIIEALCMRYGNPLSFEGKTLYTFPEAPVLAALTPGDLGEIKCGYRAEYIIEAAQAVTAGKIDLNQLAKESCVRAASELKTLKGVGTKVADCVILYGLHNHCAFPVDVWMKKALSAHFQSAFDPVSLGKAAGFAQQCIFYFSRSGNL